MKSNIPLTTVFHMGVVAQKWKKLKNFHQIRLLYKTYIDFYIRLTFKLDLLVEAAKKMILH